MGLGRQYLTRISPVSPQYLASISPATSCAHIAVPYTAILITAHSRWSHCPSVQLRASADPSKAPDTRWPKLDLRLKLRSELAVRLDALQVRPLIRCYCGPPIRCYDSYDEQ